MKALIIPSLALLVCLSLEAGTSYYNPDPGPKRTMSIYSTTGTFYNHAGGTNVTYSRGGSMISWGLPAESGQSYYRFVGAQPPGLFDLQSRWDDPRADFHFLLGTFTHGNSPINPETGITSVYLDIALRLGAGKVGDVVPIDEPLTFTYKLKHWETPNTSNPCADGGANGSGVNLNGCADRVLQDRCDPEWPCSFSSYGFIRSRGVFYDMTITIGTKETIYRIRDDGPLWTKEMGSHSLGMYGYFDYHAYAVPEPGFYGLLGLGLTGLYAAVRLRKRA